MLSAEGKLRGRWIGRSVGGLGGRGRRVFGYLTSALPDDHGCFGFFYTTCVSWFAFLLLAFDTREAGVLGLPSPPPFFFVLGLSCGWVVLRYAEEGDRFFFFGERGGGRRWEGVCGWSCLLGVVYVYHSLYAAWEYVWSVVGYDRGNVGGGVGYLDAIWDVCFLNLC